MENLSSFSHSKVVLILFHRTKKCDILKNVTATISAYSDHNPPSSKTDALVDYVFKLFLELDSPQLLYAFKCMNK